MKYNIVHTFSSGCGQVSAEKAMVCKCEWLYVNELMFLLSCYLSQIMRAVLLLFIETYVFMKWAKKGGTGDILYLGAKICGGGVF